MPQYEYKTRALTQSVKVRRKRKQTEGEAVAEVMAAAINAEAAEGWHYLRAETLHAPEQRGMLRSRPETTYVILIFNRELPEPEQPGSDVPNEERQPEATPEAAPEAAQRTDLVIPERPKNVKTVQMQRVEPVLEPAANRPTLGSAHS